MGSGFSEYGKLAHEILEKYLKGELNAFELAEEYRKRFDKDVRSGFPFHKFSDLKESYFEKGLKYFSEFTDVLDETYEVLGVEQKVEFDLEGKPFIGFIDLLAKDIDGNVIVVDHKTTSFKLKKNGQPNKESADKIEGYKKQMYLYSKPLIDQGIKPDKLCWNFLNEGITYYVDFSEKEYEDTLKWALDTIEKIRKDTEFPPKEDFYHCRHICGMRGICETNQQSIEEYKQRREEERNEQRTTDGNRLFPTEDWEFSGFGMD